MKIRNWVLLAVSAVLAGPAYAATATVDGSGAVPTGDPTFPNSYATVSAALTAVKANDTAAHVIDITTTGPLDETGLIFNTVNNLDVTGPAGGVTLRITPANSGLGTPVATAFVLSAGKTVSLSNLIITPNTGTGQGGVTSRAVQIYPLAGGLATDSTVNFTNVMFTAIRPSNHGTNPNQVITNPLQAAETTRLARYQNLRAFSGGTANGTFEVRNDNNTGAGKVVINLNDFVLTHQLAASPSLPTLPASASSANGGGIAIGRTTAIDININAGSVFSYNDSAGYRVVGTATGVQNLNVNGTLAKPVFFVANGWQEEPAIQTNVARSEGLHTSVQTLNLNYAYIVGNYGAGLMKQGAGTLAIQNSVIAENQKDLDTGTGTVQNQALSGANIAIPNSGMNSAVNLTNVTIFNNVANGGSVTASDYALNWLAVGADSTFSNVIFAGSGDQITYGAAASAKTITKNNVAVVAAGPDAMQATIETAGANVSLTDNFGVTADPDFVSRVFSATWNGLGSGGTVDPDYLSVRSTAYKSSRAVGAADIKGANANSPLPVSVSVFSID